MKNIISKSYQNSIRESGAGFTLIEIVIVILIFGVLSAVVITNFALQKGKIDLRGSAEELVSVLNLAQSKTLASTDNSQYGVYFDILASPNGYILFKGTSYSTRDSSFDVEYTLPNLMEFYSVDLSGSNEAVFDRLTGSTSQSGSLSLRIKSDTSQSQTIYLSSSGLAGFLAVVSPSDDDRVKDSRHVHFDYSRANFVNCPTTDATLYLYFNGAGTAQQTISICNNLIGGQLDLTGTVSVGGSNQTIKIDTHHLLDSNYPNGTQFSVRRDGRLNNKSLRITISGDPGYLIDYSADGLTTTYTSSYVSNSSWQ